MTLPPAVVLAAAAWCVAAPASASAAYRAFRSPSGKLFRVSAEQQEVF